MGRRCTVVALTYPWNLSGGTDLIAQAQSGTGKTCVFAVAAVEAVSPTVKALQALLLAPTREIALQTLAVVRAIGAFWAMETCSRIPLDKFTLRFAGLYVKDIRCEAFVGGTPSALDPPRLHAAHIAVATPGQRQLLVC